MNYYYRYLGDYLRDTLDLSALENGVYNFLLDSYYATEKPIPADKAFLIARASTKEEKKAVTAILGRFFKLRGSEWHHTKCDEEIQKARKRIKAAQENGAKNRPNREPSGIPSGYAIRSPSAGAIQPLNPQSSIYKNSEDQNGLAEKEKDKPRAAETLAAIRQRLGQA